LAVYVLHRFKKFGVLSINEIEMHAERILKALGLENNPAFQF